MGQSTRFVQNSLTFNETFVMSIIFYVQTRLKEVT